MPTRSPAWLSAAVFLAALVIGLTRVGSSAFRGVIWAEDGPVFLQGAYDHHGGWSVLLQPYAGYGHVVPRILSAVVAALPLSWHGFLLCFSAALVQALLSLFVFHVVRAQHAGDLMAFLLALVVPAVPVGAEVSANIANLQWFLLFAGCVAALWRPRTGVGRACSAVVLAACALSSPFGAAAVGVAGVCWLFTRRRDLLVLTGVGAAGCVVQIAVMVTSPPRETPGHAWWKPMSLLAAYLRRVAGDAVLGSGRHAPTDPASSLVPGLAVVAVVLILGFAVWRTRSAVALAVPALLLVASLVTFVIPVGLTGIDPRAPFVYAGPGRYYVAPALLLLTAIFVLVGRLLIVPSRSAASPDLPSVGPAPVWSKVLAAGVLAAVAFGVVNSYESPKQFRPDGPSWSEEVRKGRTVCASSPASRVVPLAIMPEGWIVNVPCTRLGRS